MLFAEWLLFMRHLQKNTPILCHYDNNPYLCDKLQPINMNLKKLKVLPFALTLLLITIGCENQKEPMPPEQAGSTIEKLVENMVPVEGGTFTMGTFVEPDKSKDHRAANRYYWFPDNRDYFAGLHLAL